MSYEDERTEEREVTEQWVAGGTPPEADETWSVPKDDPEATWPIERR